MKISITILICWITVWYANAESKDLVVVSLQDTVLYDTIETPEVQYDYSYDESSQINTPEKEVEKRGDTTFISVAGKKIRIIDKNGETEVNIQNKNEPAGENDQELYDDEYDSEEDYSKAWKKNAPVTNKTPGKNFKGHWSGFEFGLNNYVDKDMSFIRTEENEFMDLNTARSWNINLNFTQYSVGFGTNRAGLVTGMGLEWSNYHFSDTNSIQKQNRYIVELPLDGNTTKNRLQTTYLTIPLLFEVQMFGKKREDRFHLAAGVIGGIKLFSNTKIKYVKNGVKEKEKIKNDYYLSPLRYAFTVRAGYKAVKVYANYYPVSLFLANRGPELYPVAGGLVISF